MSQAQQSKDKRLYDASFDGEEAEVISLIKAGANVNNKEGQFGWSPLHASSANGHNQIAKILINNKANVNQLNNYRESPLLFAAKWDNFEVVKLLVSNEAEVTPNIVDKAKVEEIKSYLQNAPQFIIFKIKSIVESNEIADEIIQSKTKQWNRTNLVVLGPSSSGKSTFVECLVGLNFRHTTSTVGVEKPGMFNILQSVDNNSCKLMKLDSPYSLLNGSVAELLNLSKSNNNQNDNRQKSINNLIELPEQNIPSSSSINLDQLYKKSISKNTAFCSAESSHANQSNNTNSNNSYNNKIDSNANVSLDFDKIMKSMETVKLNLTPTLKAKQVVLLLQSTIMAAKLCLM
eukprot:gene7049-9624_t